MNLSDLTIGATITMTKVDDISLNLEKNHVQIVPRSHECIDRATRWWAFGDRGRKGQSTTGAGIGFSNGGGADSKSAEGKR